MKQGSLSFLSAVLGLVIVGSMWAMPATRAHRKAVQSATQAQDQAKTTSVTGKIASVSGSDFTIEVQKQDGSIDPMAFTTDQASKIDGKLVEGATADVTYRVESEKNIVVSARVTPPPKPQS